MSVDPRNTLECRIDGLTSATGQKKNGSVGRMNPLKSMGSGADMRLAVIVDGFSGPLSIKRVNVFFPFNERPRRFSVGIGRGTILDKTFKAALVENSQVVDGTMVTGGSARSRGTIQAMEALVNKYLNPRHGTAPIMIKLTDLNIARAMNRAAWGDESVQLAEPLKAKFQSIKQKLAESGSKKQDILVQFDSHRIMEDRFEVKKERFGPQRYQAVKSGAFQIYPCSLKQYLDSHEVRYADPTRNDIAINHEIYLDYGVEEATAYPKHAAAMEETDRLFPAILAEVDPQAFWAATLWLKQFIASLEELKLPVTLVQEWKDLEGGKQKSKKAFEKCMEAFGYIPTSLKGAEENWGIPKSQDVHIRIATDYAIGAIEAVQVSVIDEASKIVSVRINILDDYIGTEYDNYITGRGKHLDMLRKEKEETGKEPSSERSMKLLDRAMKSVGFGRDSKIRAALQDPEKVCDNCCQRNKKKFLTCARCEGASYCNAKCQKEHWKKHRSNCSRVLVQIQKQLAEINIRGDGDGLNIIAGTFKSGPLPTTPVMISEASGIGNMGIMWNPGSTSFINMPNIDAPDFITGKVDLNNPYSQSKLNFTDFTDLHPIPRFLLCCGPLPQLDVAQDCVSEAIQCRDGQIGEVRAPNVGFTALEWAAKKGNIDIVKWLCTDERTKALIHIGCPIGWAGYTGKVEIMRLLVSYGADPGSTDDILFGQTPPLMIAGQNGQLEAMKFYVNECQQDVKMVDRHGKNLLKHIMDPPNWRNFPGHRASHKWAKAMIKG